MAISRRQPMRPVLKDVLDVLDSTVEALNQEVIDRQTIDGILQDNIDAVSGSVQDETLARQEADGILQDNIDAINAKYRMNKVSITVPINDTVTETVTYTPAFDVNANIILLWQIDTVNTELTMTIAQTATGFTITAVNASTTDSITFVLSYLAIGVV